MRIRFLFLVLLMVVQVYATAPTKESVAKLYIATFDRAPDSAGLNYWLYDSGLNLEGIANSFFDQEETEALYGDVTDINVFIVAIYYNLFQRSADSAGQEYWEGELMGGNIAPSLFILAVMNGAKDDDATILENKTDVGLAFADEGLSNVADAKEIMSGVDATDQSKTDALNKFGLGEEEETETETSTYVGSQAGTVFTSSTTGLMWQNALLGHEELAEAITFCSDLSFGGYSDWRLPTLDESKDFHYNMNVQGDVPAQRFSTCTAEVVSDGYVRTKEGASKYGSEIGDPIGFSGKANVRCVRTDDGSTPNEEDSSLSSDKESVVNRHNEIRQELYTGADVSWSDTVASTAQAYAEVLASKGTMEHDMNTPYGENLAIATYNIDYTTATNMWYEEKPYYDYASNDCISGEMCGHYTQIIWKDTTEIGCGSAIIQTGRFENGVIVVCRYNPSGNYIGVQPY